MVGNDLVGVAILRVATPGFDKPAPAKCTNDS
jgi:hypothetical protein